MVLLSAAVERAVLLCCSTGVVLLSTVVVNGCGSTLAVAECYSLFLQEVLLLLAVRLDGVLGQELHELQRLLDLHQDLVDLSALDLRERERERGTVQSDRSSLAAYHLAGIQPNQTGRKCGGRQEVRGGTHGQTEDLFVCGPSFLHGRHLEDMGDLAEG